MRRFAVACIVLALAAGGAAEAKRAFTPKAGGYIGRVTNAHGKGKVQLVVATFNMGHGDQKGPQLFSWTGILRCKDGSTSEVGPAVFAPLHGARFSGRSKSGPQTVTLKGRFTSATKLKGSARVTSGDCDTGPVTFKAHRR
jgi:hypothetical protein